MTDAETNAADDPLLQALPWLAAGGGDAYDAYPHSADDPFGELQAKLDTLPLEIQADRPYGRRIKPEDWPASAAFVREPDVAKATVAALVRLVWLDKRWPHVDRRLQSECMKVVKSVASALLRKKPSLDVDQQLLIARIASLRGALPLAAMVAIFERVGAASLDEAVRTTLTGWLRNFFDNPDVYLGKAEKKLGIRVAALLSLDYDPARAEQERARNEAAQTKAADHAPREAVNPTAKPVAIVDGRSVDAAGTAPSPMPFPYLGDGGIVPEGHSLRCWVLFDNEVPPAARAALLQGVPPPLQDAIAWDGALLHLGSPSEQAWEADRSVAGLVRAHYGRGPAPKLTKQERTLATGPDMDPKVLGWAIAAKANFGDLHPWAAFYSALDAWLVAVHKQRPITLFVRPVCAATRDAGLSDLHNASLNVVAERLLDKLAATVGAEPSQPAQSLAAELILYLQPRRSAGDELDKLAPLLVHSLGIDAYAAAARDLLGRMTEVQFETFVRGGPPQWGLRVLLRTDFVQTLIDKRGFSDVLGSCLSRFWAMSPTAAPIAQLATDIAWTLFPTLRHARGASVYDQLVEELARHASHYPKATFAPLVPQIRDDGFDAAALAAAVDAMR